MKAKKGSPSSPSVNDDSWVKRSLFGITDGKRAAAVLYLGLSDLRTTFAAIRRDDCLSPFPNTVVTTLNGYPTT